MKKTIFYFILILCVWVQGFAYTQAQNYGVNNGATLKLTAGTTLKGQHFRNDNAGTLDAQGTVRLTGDFSQNNTATTTQGTTAVLHLEGSTLQNINGTSAITLNNLTLQNNAGARLNTALNINQNLTISTGDLDLNNRNIDMGTNATLSEDVTNNHIVKDLTATTEASVGGYIRFTNRNVDASPTNIGGSRVSLNRNAGTDYSVNIDRYHYSGSNGNAIKLLYRINLNTGTMTSTNLRIDYADEEAGTLFEPFGVARWSSGTGWQNLVADANSAALNYSQKNNVTAFSSWTLFDLNIALNTTILNLKGRRIDDENIQINWTTSNEINNKGFEIETSQNGIDFNKMMFIEKNTNFNYELSLKQPNSAYFRLKQLDENNHFSYSNIIFINGFQKEIKIFPNPTSDFVILENIPQNAKILVNDVSGKSILETSTKENSLKINIKNWAKGIYLIKIGKETKKIIVE